MAAARIASLLLCLASGCMHLPGTPDRPYAEVPGDDTQPAPVVMPRADVKPDRIADNDTQPQPKALPRAVADLPGDRRK